MIGKRSTARAPSRPRVYRSRDANNATALGIAMTVGFAVFAVLPGGHEPIAAYVTAAFLLAMTVRAAVVGAYVKDDTVKVVGFFKTKRVAWGDIDRFAVLPRGRYSVAHITFKDARRPLPITAIDAGGTTARNARRIQATVDQLNEILANCHQSG